MTADQITQTITTLTQAMTTQRPTISTGACTTPGCTACTKGGKR
ncbi:hypothetical protein OG884_15340 [Streptosporangium sp. NBC_01755]|nr:hypothetical protein [Streptosporangium sp. NBC_01755]WSD03207.1 hypothetical protein OG884_15340 [Streptosporangium sp. NBC_01755]